MSPRIPYDLEPMQGLLSSPLFSELCDGVQYSKYEFNSTDFYNWTPESCLVEFALERGGQSTTVALDSRGPNGHSGYSFLTLTIEGEEVLDIAEARPPPAFQVAPLKYVFELLGLGKYDGDSEERCDSYAPTLKDLLYFMLFCGGVLAGDLFPAFSTIGIAKYAIERYETSTHDPWEHGVGEQRPTSLGSCSK